MQRTRAVKRHDDRAAANIQAETMHWAAGITAPVERTILRGVKDPDTGKRVKLDAPGAFALSLVQRGVNTPERREALAQSWERSLRGENPEGQNFRDVDADVSEDYLARRIEALRSPEIGALVDNPNVPMRVANEVWTKIVDRQREALGIDPEMHAERVAQPIRLLEAEIGKTDREGEFGIPRNLLAEPQMVPRPDYPIQPTYTPDISAANIKVGRPGLLGKVGLRDEQLLREDTGRRLGSIQRAPSETLFNPRPQSYLAHAGGETFLSGAVRTDAHVMIEHAARVERDLIEKNLMNLRDSAVALRDPDGGEVMQFDGPDDVNRVAKGYVFVPIDEMIKWYRGEVDVVKELSNAMINNPERFAGNERAAIENLARDSAPVVKANYLAASKSKGIAIPESHYKRVQQHAKIHEPYNNPIGQNIARFLNMWRTYTLALMPRWWINTAVGSAILAFTKGVWNPTTYRTAMRWAGSSKTPDDIGRVKGKIIQAMYPRTPKDELFRGVEVMPPGIRLGGHTGAEMTEAGMSLHDRSAHVRWAYERVQGIEDHFRNASFVHSLKRHTDRERFNEIAESMENVPGGAAKRDLDGAGDLGDGPEDRLDDTVIDALSDPKLLETVTDEINRFSYNYSAMGPLERRYVRQFIPFWGWYKFITKFMWRLPIEYPGRTNLMVQLGVVGEEYAREVLGDRYDLMPPWVRYSILLNKDPKNLKYLSTFGLNPFGNYANPFTEKGRIGGLIGLGQAQPLVQATLAGLGIDPLTGAEVPISPEEGVSKDFLGRSFNTLTGKQISSLASVAGGRRFLAQLGRSFPGYRIGEQAALGGRRPYPENIPMFAERPMSTRVAARAGKNFQSVPLLLTGLDPATIDAERTADLAAEGLAAARSRNKSQRRKLRKKLRNPDY
jgi:hypothetical protein